MDFTTPTAPVYAVKTLNAIAAALEADQGELYRKHLRTLFPIANDIYRANISNFRTHLGASIIGKDCPREIWYNFHWAAEVKHPARILRLFNRGHIEEPRFVALLLMINCEVWQFDADRKQFRMVGHDGHFGGSLDCVARGIPDDPEIPILCEFKTHNDKSFNKLIKEGVRSAKYEHFIQMQTYMGGFKLSRALYLGVNKNDDDLHGELIDFNPELYSRYTEKAKLIINQPEPPAKINQSPGWYICKFCDFRQVCHFNVPPARNCRTCVYSQPGKDGSWFCNRFKATLTTETQLAGCPDYSRNMKI